MSGTDDLISKWTKQKAALEAEAEGMSPGAERDAVLQRIALCQKAIEAAEILAPSERYSTTPKEPSAHPRA